MVTTSMPPTTRPLSANDITEWHEEADVVVVGYGHAGAAAALGALEGTTDVLDVSDLGLDRFDEQGRSRLAPDPIALPFPSFA